MYDVENRSDGVDNAAGFARRDLYIRVYLPLCCLCSVKHPPSVPLLVVLYLGSGINMGAI